MHAFIPVRSHASFPYIDRESCIRWVYGSPYTYVGSLENCGTEMILQPLFRRDRRELSKKVKSLQRLHHAIIQRVAI